MSYVFTVKHLDQLYLLLIIYTSFSFLKMKSTFIFRVHFICTNSKSGRRLKQLQLTPLHLTWVDNSEMLTFLTLNDCIQSFPLPLKN